MKLFLKFVLAVAIGITLALAGVWQLLRATPGEWSHALRIGPFETNALITPFVASVVALGLNEAAYMAEIVRAGILSVDQGQVDVLSEIPASRRKVRSNTDDVIPEVLENRSQFQRHQHFVFDDKDLSRHKISESSGLKGLFTG